MVAPAESGEERRWSERVSMMPSAAGEMDSRASTEGERVLRVLRVSTVGAGSGEAAALVAATGAVEEVPNDRAPRTVERGLLRDKRPYCRAASGEIGRDRPAGRAAAREELARALMKVILPKQTSQVYIAEIQVSQQFYPPARWALTAPQHAGWW